jgi:ABC-type phosphate/phosphonate transport system substrate-binding protein
MDAAHGRIDFALQDPHTFRQVSHLFDTGALLQMRSLDDSTNQQGVLVVRRDSGLTDPAQLRGRTVMFGPRTSSPKWVAARLLFESRGVAVDSDLKVMNGGCCEDIAFAVSARSVDAGVVCDHFLGAHSVRQKELGVASDALAIIGRTPSVPTRVLAPRKGVTAEVVTAVTRALLELDPANPAHAGMLERAEFRGFVRTTEAEYLKGLGGPKPRGRP